MTHHPRPWWFELALRFCPQCCREIPEAQDPSRIVLRQVAIIKRHLYLQQFASSEDLRWMHSHQWRFMVALGLWGGYDEHRLAGRWWRCRRAPYLYWFGSDLVHHALHPTPGHTSLFLGLWRDDSLKRYYPVAQEGSRGWEDHIRVKVARI